MVNQHFTYGLFDEDDELRYVFPDIVLALRKVRSLGWGEIYSIEIKKTSRCKIATK